MAVEPCTIETPIVTSLIALLKLYKLCPGGNSLEREGAQALTSAHRSARPGRGTHCREGQSHMERLLKAPGKKRGILGHIRGVGRPHITVVRRTSGINCRREQHVDIVDAWKKGWF